MHEVIEEFELDANCVNCMAATCTSEHGHFLDSLCDMMSFYGEYFEGHLICYCRWPHDASLECIVIGD